MSSLRDRLEKRIQRHWYQPDSASILLRLLGWCYGRVVRRRREKYQLAPRTELPVPVVVVGNITLGGTGKSPLVAALVKILEGEDYHPAILTRGYGSKGADHPHLVDIDDTAELVGDEALMLKQTLGCPVVVDPVRERGIKQLIQKENPDIIICDDGLQHYALQRDIEIVVIDASRGLGNGLLLPAGPLREPASRLDEVDLVVSNGSAAKLDEQTRRQVSYEFHLKPSAWRHLASGQLYDIEARPFGKEIQAVAGIGNPERFFQTLESLGLVVEPFGMPDHFAYQKQDLPTGTKPLVMTAKDAVKCRAFAEDNWWVLDVVAELPQAMSQDFLQRCEQLISRSAE